MQNFLIHLSQKSPFFLCYKSSDKKENLDLKVPVTHSLNSPANEKAIKTLVKFIPNNNDQLLKFYSTLNGAKLYCQNGQPKIELFPIEKWFDENKDWQNQYEDMSSEELYDFQKHGIAIGEISQLGNYFIFYEGKIYYADHDGFDEIILGNSFYEFLENIILDPAKFMHDRGCHSRYEDGKTNSQWIPKKYQADNT